MIRVQRSIFQKDLGQIVPLEADQCLGDLLFLLGDFAEYVASDPLINGTTHYEVKLVASVAQIAALTGQVIEDTPATRVALVSEAAYDVLIIPWTLPATIFYTETRSPPAYEAWVDVGDGPSNNTSAGQMFYPDGILPNSAASQIAGKDCFVIVYHGQKTENRYMTSGLDRDGASTTVCLTTLTTLYHELMHVEAGLQGIVNAAIAETYARGRENELRNLLGYAIRSTDATIPVELGTAALCELPPPVATPPSTPWCLIVSACTDPEDQRLIGNLRTIRELCFRSTSLGCEFFDVLLWEYYSVSPQISALLRLNPDARRDTREFVVLPYLSFLSAVFLGTEIAILTLGDQQTRLLEDVTNGKALCGVSIPDDMAVLRWAILDPIRILAEIGRMKQSGVSLDQLSYQFERRVGQWKARLPIIPAFVEIDRTLLRADSSLERFFRNTPRAFRGFENRLALGPTTQSVEGRIRPTLEVKSATIRSEDTNDVLLVVLRNPGVRWAYVVERACIEGATVLVGIRACAELNPTTVTDSALLSVPPRSTIELRIRTDLARVPSTITTVHLDWMDFPFYHVALPGQRSSFGKRAIAGERAVKLTRTAQYRQPRHPPT